MSDYKNDKNDDFHKFVEDDFSGFVEKAHSELYPNGKDLGCIGELMFVFIMVPFYILSRIVIIVAIVIVCVIVFFVGSFILDNHSSENYVLEPKTTSEITSASAPKVEISEEEKKLAEEKRAAEIERNRKNAEENKKKMEALYGKQRNTEQSQHQTESLSVKQKMDMLIPIAVKCNWKEADVREAVQLMENCGVRFNMLSANEPEYNSNLNQFAFRIKDSMYNSSPLLHVRVNNNHISRIGLEITSNTAVNYFREKSNQRIEPFKHSYSNDILLYAKDNERELVNKNNFDKIIFNRTELDKIKAQANSYIKSKGGTGFDNFSLKVAVQFETDTYNNPVKIPIDDFVNGKVLFLCQVDFSARSEVYGKDKDHYHAEILINGDNVQEISLKGDNIEQTPSNKI